jgi:LPXTG-motif cell wall-anchored protein
MDNTTKGGIEMRVTATLLSVFLLMFMAAPVSFAAGKNCSDFKTQEEAQRYFESHGGSKTNNVDGLDRDHDGIACEKLPKGSSSVGGEKGTADKGQGDNNKNNSQPQEGGQLPKTASSYPAMAVLGVVTAFAGIGLLFFNRKLKTN